VQNLDALLPTEVARKAEQIGVEKARLDITSLFALAVLAGIFSLFVKTSAPVAMWSQIGTQAGDYEPLTWAAFATGLIPVTIGNIVGGAVLVGATYGFIYLRRAGAYSFPFSSGSECPGARQ
jgi:formate/nitrite transporter FocA (FNT family)